MSKLLKIPPPYACTIEYSSAVKKKEIWPFAATWMDLKGITLSEITQRKVNTTYEYDITHMWNLKNTTSEYNKKQPHRHREQTIG